MNKVKRILAYFLIAALLVPNISFIGLSDTAVTSLAIVKYSESSPIIDYTTAKTSNQAGSFVYGSSCTAVYNSATGAIDVSATSSGGNFALSYFDSYFSLTSTTNCCFAILYKTESGTKLGDTGFDRGYYVTDMNASSVNGSVRPQFTNQTITIDGEQYYLATATLDNSTAGITSGQRIYGIRFNVVITGTPYSIYSSGVFSSANDAISYFENINAVPEASSTTPLALMNCSSDDDNGYKESGVTTQAKGGSVWIGGVSSDALTYSYDQEKSALSLSSTSSGAWFAQYLDRPYTPKAGEKVYAAVLYETDDGQTRFSSAKGYSYRSYAFLPIVDGTARLEWSYVHGFKNKDGKTYSIAYAPISDAAPDVNICGFQISVNSDINYYLHSAGIFKDVDSIKAYYYDFTKTSQKELENFDELLTPYWEGNIVYEESVMVLTDEDGSIAPISLTYPIDKIIKVTDAVKSIEYKKGMDYSLENGKLTICDGTSIPVTDYGEYYFDNNDDGLTSRKAMTDGSGRYTFFTEGAYWHYRQILVTYEHSGEWKGDIPYGQSYKLPKTMEKLKNNKELNIVVNGLSNTTGCNCSSKINAQPFLPNWADMTVSALKNKFNNDNITMVNTSVGGTTASWANENVQANVIDYEPDLVFIEQGLNDPTLSAYRENMVDMVAKIKEALPDCEIVLVNSTMANPDVSGHYAHQESYVNILHQIADSYEGIVVANVGAVHDYFLSIKEYRDMTGNNVNHVNDFAERMYAQVILKVFDEYEYESDKVSAPLAFARYTSIDTGSVKPSGNYLVEKGSAWVGGDNTATIEFDVEKDAIHIVGNGVSSWAGLQFDSYTISSGEPYYAAVLYSTKDNVYSRFSNTAGYSYLESAVSSFLPDTLEGRLKWKYDYVGSADGNDYFMCYYRVTDMPEDKKLSGIQVILNTGVDYYFYSAGIFDSYESIITAFKSVIPVGLSVYADYNNNTVLIPYENKANGVAGSICYNSETASHSTVADCVLITKGSSADPYVYYYLDSNVVLQADNKYYIAVLYDSPDSNRLTSAYYCSNYTGGLVGTTTELRPSFVSNDIEIGGKTYCLGISEIDMSTSKIPINTSIAGVRFKVLSSSYNVYGIGVFESKTDLYNFVKSRLLIISNNFDGCSDALDFTRFGKSDVVEVKELGSYIVPHGSITAGLNTTTISYNADVQGVEVRTDTAGDWLGVQLDDNYTVTSDKYYTAVLFGTKGVFSPLLKGYSYYYNASNSFLTLGSDVGRLDWIYKYVGTLDGYDRYIAIAEMSDVVEGTLVSGMQFALKTNVDYCFYSAGIFADYKDALVWMSDLNAPDFNGIPTLIADGISINAYWNEASDDNTDSASIVYKLYVSKDEIVSSDLPAKADKVTGACNAEAKYLDYGTGYYTAIEATDKSGNKTLWISPEKTFTEAVPGDVNTDKSVDSLDAALLKKILLGTESVEGPYAMVNSDSAVDIRDLVRLKKLLASIKEETLSFEELGLERPNVTTPATIVFGTYQNMGQLAESPEDWTFIRKYGDGILFHEAYWLNSNSPQATYGKTLADFISDSSLKVYLEYGMPKSDITFTDGDDGTAYGTANANRAYEKISRFVNNTGLNIDILNLELYSGAVTNILNDLGYTHDTQKAAEGIHEIGVEYLLNSYDVFYNSFTQNFGGVKINHVGCPNLTGWVRESEGGTLPRYWIDNYEQPYWSSYQAYDVTIPIFEKYKNDNVHIGFVHDSPWNSFDIGKLNKYGTQDKVIEESVEIIRGTYGYNSTLIVGDWDSSFGDTVTDEAAIDKFYWENSLKSIFNAQYQGMYHDQYIIESYWAGPYTMVSEDDKYTYANLVKTAIEYLKGIGQDLDLTVTDSNGNTLGRGVYSETPSTNQLFTKSNETETYTVTVTNKGDFVCNPWFRAVENAGGATITYKYNGEDITELITSEQGFTFKDLFEDEAGNFDSYTSTEDAVLDTHFDEQKHGLDKEASVTIEVTVSGGSEGAVAICGFYNPQDSTDTIKDVVTIKF